jgi:hypothetical protein
MKRSLVVAWFLLAVAAACDSFSGAEEPAAPVGGEDASPPSNEAGTDATKEDGGVPCVGKNCPPVVLAEMTQPIPYLALDATRVIWMTSTPPLLAFGNVYACPRATACGAGPMTLRQNIKANAIGSDGTSAWVSDVSQGKIFKVGPVGLDDLYPSLPQKRSILWLTPRDGGLLANAYEENDASPHPRGIYRADLVAQGYQDIAFYTGNENAENTVFTNTHVYLGAHDMPMIVAASLGGGSFIPVNTSELVSTMTTDGNRVFFSDGAGPIFACNGDGNTCAQTTVLQVDAAFGGAAELLYAADGRLFFETAGGMLVSCDPNDCPGTAKILAHEDAFATEWHFWATNIAVDAEFVYYVARKGAVDANPTYFVKRVAREPK